MEIIHTAQASGQSFDVGLMQINAEWLRRLKLSPDFIIEPANNIQLGAWILSQEIARHGLGWKAVASYHTPVAKYPERARLYAIAVINHLWNMY